MKELKTILVLGDSNKEGGTTMSNTNYNKMSTQTTLLENDSKVIDEVITDEEEIEITESEGEVISDEAIMPETVNGIITNCVKLNIREKADINSKVLCVIPEGSEVTVHSGTLPNEWFSIITDSGIEGFCMSKYVTIEE